MREMLSGSVFFGAAMSLVAYEIGILARRRLKSPLFNPLLVAIVLVMAVLLIFRVDYQSYNNSARYISFLLTPATVCLAIPLYEHLTQLKQNFRAITAGIVSGVLTSLLCILAMSVLFRLSHSMYVTMLPKSVTTAMGMGVSQELGGVVAITVAVIIITGIFGNMTASLVCRLFRVHDPVAKGVAIGTSAHAIGTARAMELGAVEGAMSSLSLAVAGILTVVVASVFAQLY